MGKYAVLPLLAALLVVPPLPVSHSQPATGNAGYQVMVEAFFRQLQDGRVGDAAAQFLRQNPWSVQDPDTVEQARARLLSVTKALGRYYGYQPLVEKALAGRLIHASYLALYERHPLRFSFLFYKPQDAWLPLQLEFDDDFGKEIRNAARMEGLLSVEKAQ